MFHLILPFKPHRETEICTQLTKEKYFWNVSRKFVNLDLMNPLKLNIVNNCGISKKLYNCYIYFTTHLCVQHKIILLVACYEL